jgi:hypothetical protein
MPFTIEQFFEVFARYNLALWPWQIAAVLAGIAVVALLWREARSSAVAITLILSAMWLINGIGYHWTYFAAVNPAARLFAAAFVLQGLLLAGVAFTQSDLRFRVRRVPTSLFGLACVAFALALYPLVGWLVGHRYPATPMFGVAPCPTTIFTIGVLVQGPWRQMRWLLVIPGLWAAVGGSASILLGVPQDYALVAALVALLAMAVGHVANRQAAQG